MAASEFAVAVKELTKTYGQRQVLNGVTLSAAPGTVVGLIGSNGAGKTTLIETLIGLRQADGGSVEVLGQPVDPASASRINPRVALQTQTGKLPRHQTVAELMHLRAVCADQADSVADMLDLIGLAHISTSRIGKLSGGELQRLRLGLALVTDPDLLLLDEPTVALDPASTETVWALIQGRRDTVTVFLNTQSMDEAEQLCDNVYILQAGRIIAGGSPKELIELHAGQGRFVCHVPRRSDFDASRVPGVITSRLDRGPTADTFTVVTEDIARTKNFLDHSGMRYKQHPPSLVDVFLCLTQEGESSA